MTNYIFTELNNGDILFAALENGLHGSVRRSSPATMTAT